METTQATELKEWILNNYRALGLDGKGLFLGRNIFILRLVRSNNRPANADYYHIYGMVVKLMKSGTIPDSVSTLSVPPQTDVTAMKEYIQYRYYLEGTELRDTTNINSLRIWFVLFERFLARLETGPELKGTQNRELRQSLAKLARNMEQNGEIETLQGNIIRIITPTRSTTHSAANTEKDSTKAMLASCNAPVTTFPVTTQHSRPSLQTQITQQAVLPFSFQPIVGPSNQTNGLETRGSAVGNPSASQTNHDGIIDEENSTKGGPAFVYETHETVPEISSPVISISSSCHDMDKLDGITRSVVSEVQCTPANDNSMDGEHDSVVVFSDDFGPLKNISMDHFRLLGSPTSTLQYTKDRDPGSQIYFNTVISNSFFVYGLQSSGMSDTVICLLENFLLNQNPTKAQPDQEVLESPSGLVLHFTPFTFLRAFKPCEAVSLAGEYEIATAETPAMTVNVFVTPFNLSNMKKAYSRVSHAVVRRLQLHMDRLNPIILLAILFPEGADPRSLCYQKISQLLRFSVIQSTGILDYSWFVENIRQLTIDEDDRVRFLLKLELLETFLTADEGEECFSSELANPGTLTVVDLSCPFVDSNMACALFNLCLEEYMDTGSTDSSRVVTLDGAHKFITDDLSASKLLTEHILGLKLQDQQATKIIISGEHTNLSVELINTDPNSMLFIHRHTDVDWLHLFKSHFPVSGDTSSYVAQLLDLVTSLEDNECLFFAPLKFITASHLQSLPQQQISRAFLRLRVRNRITTPTRSLLPTTIRKDPGALHSTQPPLSFSPTASPSGSVLLAPTTGSGGKVEKEKLTAGALLHELIFRKPQSLLDHSLSVPPLNEIIRASPVANPVNLPKQPLAFRTSFDMFQFGDCAETIPLASIPESLENIETHSATSFVSQLSQLKTFLQDPPAYPSPVFLPPCDKCRSLMSQLDGKCLLRSALGWIDKARWQIETPFSQVGVVIPAGQHRTLGLTTPQMGYFNSLLMADAERIYEMLDSFTADDNQTSLTREIYTEFLIPFQESNRVYKTDENGNLLPYTVHINGRTLPLCTVFCAIAYILSLSFASRPSQTKQEALSMMIILADWCKKLSPWYYPKVVSIITLKGYQSAVGLGDEGVKLDMVLGTSKPSNMGMNASYYDADWGLRKLGYQMKLHRRAALQRGFQLSDDVGMQEAEAGWVADSQGPSL